MKPKTKIQKRIIQLKTQIPKITAEQKKYAEIKAHDSFCTVAYTQKHYCLDCGNIWNDNKAETIKNKGCTCPKCNKKLKLVNLDSRNNYQGRYYSIITAIDSFQIVRVFTSEKHLKKGEKYRHLISEVMQHWIDNKGKIHTISKPTQTFSYYYDNWSYGDLEFRTPNYHKDYHKLRLLIHTVYPKMKVLPILKRNGFKKGTHNILPHLLFSGLLKNSRVETLFKAKQYYLVDEIVRERLNVQKYWNSLKTALKQGYKIKNVSDWKDYIDLLEFFNKDIKNPKYVCPQDLKKEHDRYVEKKRQFDKAQKLKELKAKINKANREYRKHKKQFFGLIFQDNNLVITPIKTVKDFFEEAESLKHCLFVNEYYNKANSLIFSAQIQGKRIETIELSLKDFKIIQSRGMQNTPTKYNGKIRKLINQNIKTIKKVAYQKAS